MRCSGKTTNGYRCKRSAVTDSAYCALHETNADVLANEVPDNAITTRVRMALESFDILNTEPTSVAHPIEELARLAGEAVRWKDVIAARLAKLSIDEVRYESEIGTEQLRSEVALFERALDRCNTVLLSIAKLHLDERLVKIEEAKASIITSALEKAFTAADITPEQMIRARTALIENLREVA